GDAARNPAQLLMHRAQILGVDHFVLTTHGAGGAVAGDVNEDCPVATLAGVSAITIDCHSCPYHGLLTLEDLTGAAICAPPVKSGPASPSITVNDFSPTRTNLSRSRACCSTYAGSAHWRCSCCRAATVWRCGAMRARSAFIWPCWLSVERTAGTSAIDSNTKIDARMTRFLMDRGVCSSCEGRRARAAAAGRVPRALTGAVLPARDEAVRRGFFGVPPGRRVVATLRPCSGLVSQEGRDVEAREGAGAGITCSIVQLLLDPQQLVVLGHPLGPSGGTALDLATVGRHGQVGDGRVLGLTRAVAHHAGVPGTVRHVDRIQGL